MSALEVASIVEDPATSSALLSVGPTVTSQYQTNTTTNQVAERVKKRNTYRRNFQNNNWGSQGIQFSISNRNVIDELVCHMKIGGPLPADTVLPRGWGISAIDEVQFDFGGSETLEYSGRELWQMLMSEADTDDKRLAVQRLCGEKCDSSSPASAQDDMVAHVPIPLPWSSFKCLDGPRHAGYDSRLINANIQVTIRLAQKSCVFAGAGAGSAPNSLEYGYFQLKTNELFEAKDQLIRQQLLMNPSAVYNYRFLYHQPNFVGRFTGSTDNCAPVTLDLSGFRHGNLQAIVLMARRVSDGPSSQTAIKNELMYRPIRNVRMLHSGNEFYVTDANGDGQVDCLSASLSSGCFADSDYIVPGQTTAPFTSIPEKSHWTKVSLVPYDEKTFDGYVQSGMDFGGETLQVMFNTEEDVPYEMYASYVYLAHASTGNQTARIRFTLR